MELLEPSLPTVHNYKLDLRSLGFGYGNYPSTLGIPDTCMDMDMNLSFQQTDPLKLEFTIEVQSNAEQVPTHTERGRALSPVRGWGQPVAA